MLTQFVVRFYTYFIIAGFFLTAHLQAVPSSSSVSKDTLIVGVAGSAPFVFDQDDNHKGIAIEIWEELAKEKGWSYKFNYFESVDAVLDALNEGDLDVVAGPISITSHRLEYMKFSQPFYNSSLAILSRSDKLTLWERISPIFSMKLLLAVLVFLIILSFVGALLWLAERKKSPDQFPENPIDGIANGMWLAIVTMSTTGYGDKAPITVWGRILAYLDDSIYYFRYFYGSWYC